ncbi:hypothetical protein B0H16DRAFT_1723161 [Mycena metata]|uniref:Uncharacterized protein n=1 Tax=Mycena metata TaxID=1033252 RepID=A0AAD7J0T6_9AGAR|nr:hypothetical protein B0H16DRAFT_1723161 [Mycena metata]
MVQGLPRSIHKVNTKYWTRSNSSPRTGWHLASAYPIRRHSTSGVMRHCVLKTHPPAELLDLLPVHHVLVDPARIPTQEQLDPLSLAAETAVDVAVLSIQALFDTVIPVDTRSDLWPRVFVGAPLSWKKWWRGAEGSVDNLADLLIRQLRYCSVAADGTLSAYEVAILHLSFSVIERFVRYMDPADPDSTGDVDIQILRTTHAVYLALLARKLLKYATTSAACALGQTRVSSSDKIGCIETSIHLMVAVFRKQAGYRLVSEAINNGLLRAILAFSKQEVTDSASKDIFHLLVDILGVTGLGSSHCAELPMKCTVR